MGDLAHLAKGSKVEIEITEQGMFVKPAETRRNRLELPYSEADLVRGLDIIKSARG